MAEVKERTLLANILTEVRIMRKKTRIEKRGSIINQIGGKIFFQQGLDQRYCSNFLDTGETYRQEDKCRFVHAFTQEDL